MTINRPDSRFTKNEEMANAGSHLAGVLLSITGLIFMLIRSVASGDPRNTVAAAIFGSTMIFLYFSSTMTHSLRQGKLKDAFFSIDKIAIYFLIAGTYTPFALITLRGPLGWTLFGIEWAGALAGSWMVLRKTVIYEKGVNTFSVITYAVMGWLILIAIVPVTKALPLPGWLFILIGGVLYSIGILFYKKGKFRYHHLVWHLLVMAGTAAHFYVIFAFVISGG